MTDPNSFSPGCTEVLVADRLNALIAEVKERCYTDDLKRSPEFSTHKTDLETLGIIVSKYCRWNGNEIEIVALSAFEDSNFDAQIEY